MIRKGALTLGAVLMLGGVSGARADDLTGLFDATRNAASLPSWGELIQGIPQNWSDLPVRFNLSESIGYNSNVLGNTASASSLLFPASGKPIGAFESISSYGLSTSTTWGIHQISFDASAGMTRYINHADLDTYQYAVHGADAWRVSRCSGSLAASESRSESPFGQSVGFGQINNVTSTAFNETTSCSIAGNYSANFNAGYTNTINSNGSTSLVTSLTPTSLNRLNNTRAIFVSAGITYSITETDSLQALATITGTHYPGRQNLTQLPLVNPTALGLVADTTQDAFNVTYTRQLQPNVSLIASAGVLGVRDAPFGLEWPSKIEPQYSLSLNWRRRRRSCHSRRPFRE